MKRKSYIQGGLIGFLVLFLPVFMVPLPGWSQAAEVKFGDVTAKFVRNMKLIRSLTPNPELAKMIDNVVGKAEDLQSFNNDKNADEKRLRIMKQMDAMLERDGIKQSDQNRLQKLQTELQDLDPNNNFQKARSEMNRSLGEMQNFLGQIHSPDPRSEDLVRLIRMHVTFYNRCLSKMN
jgi:hypothetical protein